MARFYRQCASVLVACVLAFAVTSGATFLSPLPKQTRKLNVVRQYEIAAKKGDKITAEIPAVMSFWGSTNQQVILQSDFVYSIKPDKIEVTATNRGTPRRWYEMTWEKPQTEKLVVTQRLVIELSCENVLFTAAKLPYPQPILARFAPLLGKDEDINPESPELEAICNDIKAKAQFAEDAVESVCDWVNDNIKFKSGANGPSDTIFADKQGNCWGLAHVACAILRKLGIPATPVPAKFVCSDNNHGFIEVYFPDAGWVFYDLSNHRRGYMDSNVLLTLGYGFRVKGESELRDGNFCVEQDAAPYKEPPQSKIQIRPGPKEAKVEGVKVQHQKTPDVVPVRHQPLCDLILDQSVPPGKRPYTKESPPGAAKDAMPDKKTDTPSQATTPAQTSGAPPARASEGR